MIINKRYDLNFIDTLISLYGYKADIHIHGIIVITGGPNSFYRPRIKCEVNDDKYENGGNFYINRFSIEFAGFGNCEKEKEELIYNNIVKAKQLVDLLNKYVDKCNEAERKIVEDSMRSNTVDSPPNGKQCILCGKPVYSNSAVQKVCDKCASEYQF